MQDVEQRSPATKLFLGLLAGIGILYAVILTYHVSTPFPASDAAEAHWLERCRQMCAEYGLVYSGDVKEDVEAYLEAVESEQLSAPLEEILSDAEFERAASQSHPLIGKTAPDFELVNSNDESVRLSPLTDKGPVVLVFYYGYNCSHCVAQLFALQKDLELFEELDAQVVAISADTPEFTREQFAEYGGFTFPVLSDADYAVSEDWSVYVRPSDTELEDLVHGTFVIDGNGTVVFANRGYQPFLDNKSLLHWIANPVAADDVEGAASDVEDAPAQ